MCTHEKGTYSICSQRISRSATQSDYALRSLVTKSMCIIEYIDWERVWSDCMEVPADPDHRSFITKTCLFKYIENLPSTNENFQIKNSDIFHISAQNIECGYSLEPPRWSGSNEYPQSVFLSRNKKNNVYPCKPQFYYIKVGFKVVKII